MGLGKAHPPTNLEIAITCRCRNITGKPQICEDPLAQGHAHFFSECNFMTGLRKPKLHPDILGRLAQGHFLIWAWFSDGPWQTQAAYQIWSR